ncbi:MAG: nucleotidyl transferase AbiEii/AbiGii toxin family protein [Verrucomicrobiota bacterium]
MPLTPFQATILRLIAANRSHESHLARASAIHAASASIRFSGDLDLFHDSEESVAESYNRDSATLSANGFQVRVMLSQPGFIRASVEKDGNVVLVDWARDSVWRFMPPVLVESIGYVLHPVDLAINKVLALGGRDEPRDWVDILYLDRRLISLGALVFAAVGKDPGLNPSMLLELLGRKGHLQSRDLERIHFAEKPDLQALRRQWDAALKAAKAFVAGRPAKEAGHLYLDPDSGKFFAPGAGDPYQLHPAAKGGVLPKLSDASSAALTASADMRKDLEMFFGAPWSASGESG